MNPVPPLVVLPGSASAMMLFSERTLTLDEAAACLPGTPSKTTVWRWCVEGIGGIKLEHRRVGRRIWTSVEALDRFALRLAEAGVDGNPNEPASTDAAVPDPPRPKSSRREQDIRRAELVLERAGF